MAIFSRTKERFDRIERALQNSFFVVRKDISDVRSQTSNSLLDVRNNLYAVSQWLSYFNQRIQQQQQALDEISAKMPSGENIRESIMEGMKEEMRRYVDEYYSMKPLLERMDSVEKRLSSFHLNLPSTAPSDPPEVQTQLKAMQQRLLSLEERKLNMREKILKKISRNSKEYVKSVMLSYIRKYEKIPAIRLKEMVVEEQGLCSKSSFYRMLDELENEDDVGVIKANKEKHY